MRTSKLAFALGGLAGNNAHGAGFLQAALKHGIDPDLISCTSGQIYWTYHYLQARRGNRDLRHLLEQDVRELRVTNNRNLDTALLAIWGKPGVFRLAYPEYFRDLCSNTLKAGFDLAQNAGSTFILEELLRTLPARILVPQFPASLFEAICDEFRRSQDIGIVFNSYHPIEGCEYVHLNGRARELMAGHAQTSEARFAPKQPDGFRDRVVYQDMTPESVRDGLWIYQYGFDKASGFLDGAYFRQVMLGELTSADAIFVVRPLSHRWIGALPTSYIETEDLKTEVAFDGAYAGERNQIQLINKLLAEGQLTQGKYHPIELQEIEINVQRGFFDYLYEKLDVFDAAAATAARRFEDVGLVTMAGET